MADAALVLYTTSACHLCEQAEHLLAQLAWPVPLEVEVVDVSADEILLQRYGTRIPVLAIAQADQSWREVDWPFELQAVQELLPLPPCEQ